MMTLWAPHIPCVTCSLPHPICGPLAHTQIDDLIAGRIDADTAHKLESHHLFKWVTLHMQSKHMLDARTRADEATSAKVNEAVFQSTTRVLHVLLLVLVLLPACLPRSTHCNSHTLSSHQLIVYHLKHTDTPLPGRVRALWKMTSLGEYTATWFFWNIGAHRNTDEEAIAVKGQYAAVCGGTGCSIFIVVNANYFGEVRARCTHSAAAHLDMALTHLVPACLDTT